MGKKEGHRKYIRLKAHHLVKYKIADEQRKGISFASDVSAGGALFYSEEEIPMGTVLDLWINFPAFPRPIKTVSRVVRAFPLKKMGGFEIGVEFVEIEEEARAFMEAKIGKKKKGDNI